MRWAIYIARMGEMRNAYKMLVGKADLKRSLERFERAVDDITLDNKI
jgi:hypothetical protein